MVILDNFRSHHSKAVKESAVPLNIKLIFLPPYSPDLNPIEFIWKSVKRAVSIAAINSEYDLKSRIKECFDKLSLSLSFKAFLCYSDIFDGPFPAYLGIRPLYPPW